MPRAAAAAQASRRACCGRECVMRRRSRRRDRPARGRRRRARCTVSPALDAVSASGRRARCRRRRAPKPKKSRPRYSTISTVAAMARSAAAGYEIVRPDRQRQPRRRRRAGSRPCPLEPAPSDRRRVARPPSTATTVPASRLRKPMNSATSRWPAAHRAPPACRSAGSAPSRMHDDAVGERQRLLLVVRDVDGRRAEHRRGCGGSRRASPAAAWRRGWRAARPSAPAAAPSTMARAIATRCCWPPESWPGSLSACASSRTSAERLVDAARRPRPAARRCIVEPEADILAHGHVREQGVVLEHHAEAALLRPQPVDPASRRARCRRRSTAAARRCSSAPSTCRSRTGRAGR